MNILGIDASNKGLLIALKKDNSIYYENNFEKNSGSYIVSLINKLLKNNNINIEDIDLFGCTIGPGSFTGIRISIASLQGMLFNKTKTVVPVISTEILFDSYNGPFKKEKIAILKRARVDAAYVHIFENEKTIFSPNLISINNLKDVIQDSYLLGEESLYFKEKLDLKNKILPVDYSVKSFIEYIEKNKDKAIPAKDLKILYLQKPLAVENFEKKNNIKIDKDVYN
ncbi:tRNA (adenosine(37)-N6)-threonylcarbamoyltransferase complex dimerization subunit type 1 TsaB [Marinitoga aeolica]|uniref:tRNA (Adenosine(37)-N6)-threonylcarbamoyltransferase complex dimerization subunit type 1 TsaB n=1 Tax=Marinitoga aeolica TaxID=2809031 RepID=A0ABY8PNS3_9BACT|nr:tRNA (adenosine(37)-N6)-threonylcarbamoyltransferase complex dimerization subunit type 1 TsaB [Marinitoga aeolica]WGS64239.1 tRNA (adenosine(37)-N6)-threonylcarbamoyltransferase complex dimerization subunit type 1 TsaB [Marinitoga aeolica]